MDEVADGVGGRGVTSSHSIIRMTDKIQLTDEVRTVAGRTGRVSEFDEVDGHLMVKVWFAGYPAFEWHKVTDLTRV
jgi:hypothetical protein